MKTFEVEIEGTSPYLMHKFYGLDDGSAEKRSKTRIGVPDWKKEAEKALYKNTKGEVYVPALQIEGAMVKSAVTEKIPGRRGKTYKDLVKAFVFVEPDEIIMHPQKWEMDARAVVIQRNRVVRYRPKWDKWSLKFYLTIHESEQIPSEVIKLILDGAGRFTGIGDYRPRFGRFIVTKFKEIKGDKK